MLQTLRGNNQKGFTLIELMIVIAIIGILAAIAIPQFAAYRVRGFNSSAQSDVRNAATSQAALFSDWQAFGGTAAVAVANPLVFGAFGGGLGPVIEGPTGTLLGAPGTVPVIQVTSQGANRGLQIPLGNGVMLSSGTEGGAGGVTSFTAVGKHRRGNTYYGVDSDTTAVYFDEAPALVGTALLDGQRVASTAGIDNFTGVAGPSGVFWAVR